jgi:hypothetical protein
MFPVCPFTSPPHKAIVNKDFFTQLYSLHLSLSVYPSSPFLGSLGSLIELVNKKKDLSLQTPWESVPAEYTIRSKLYGTKKESLLREDYHNVVLLHLTRILCPCQ